MNLIFQPLLGADPLFFGMSRSDTRLILKTGHLYNNPVEQSADKYTNGIIPDFDGLERLQYIEVFEPSSAILMDIEFFADDLVFVLDKLRYLDDKLCGQDGSYFPHRL